MLQDQLGIDAVGDEKDELKPEPARNMLTGLECCRGRNLHFCKQRTDTDFC